MPLLPTNPALDSRALLLRSIEEHAKRRGAPPLPDEAKQPGEERLSGRDPHDAGQVPVDPSHGRMFGWTKHRGEIGPEDLHPDKRAPGSGQTASQVVRVPGHGLVRFPDSMKDDEIVAAIKKLTPAAPPTTDPDWQERTQKPYPTIGLPPPQSQPDGNQFDPAKLNSLLTHPLAAGLYGVLDQAGASPKTRDTATGIAGALGDLAPAPALAAAKMAQARPQPPQQEPLPPSDPVAQQVGRVAGAPPAAPAGPTGQPGGGSALPKLLGELATMVPHSRKARFLLKAIGMLAPDEKPPPPAPPEERPMAPLFPGYQQGAQAGPPPQAQPPTAPGYQPSAQPPRPFPMPQEQQPAMSPAAAPPGPELQMRSPNALPTHELLEQMLRPELHMSKAIRRRAPTELPTEELLQMLQQGVK